jgi:uncharacterized protein (DUF305 family)
MKRKSLFLTLIILMLLNLMSKAQAQSMAGMNIKPSQNIYLRMMDTMMVAMAKAPDAPTTGNYFLAEMIPHHEGAISMAKYEIAHGRDFKLIQLAKSIDHEQTNEIRQMQLWLKEPTPSKDLVTARYKKEMDATMNTMMANMPAIKKLVNTDRSFALVMIPHHQAAIDMAKVLLKYSNNKTIKAYAEQLISAQEIEIEQMKNSLK